MRMVLSALAGLTIGLLAATQPATAFDGDNVALDVTAKERAEADRLGKMPRSAFLKTFETRGEALQKASKLLYTRLSADSAQ